MLPISALQRKILASFASRAHSGDVYTLLIFQNLNLKRKSALLYSYRNSHITIINGDNYTIINYQTTLTFGPMSQLIVLAFILLKQNLNETEVCMQEFTHSIYTLFIYSIHSLYTFP